MAKVYAFPMKKKLPTGIEDQIKKIAKDYVEILYAASMLLNLESNPPSPEEMQEMVGVAFAEGIVEAIDELDES